MVGWMPYRSQRSETGVCSRRWSRRMAAFSWTGSRFRVFLGMGGPPLEVVAYSSRPLVPFQLKQNRERVLDSRRRALYAAGVILISEDAHEKIARSLPALPCRLGRCTGSRGVGKE